MHRVFLLNETKDLAYDTLISELTLLNEIVPIVSHNAEDLEASIKENPLDLLLIIVDQAPSDVLIDIISLNRNLIYLRETHFVSIHRNALASGVQKSLMMGSKNIYLEPIERKRLIRAISDLVNDNPTFLDIPPEFHKVSPTPFSVELFGRIGKIYSEPLGDLHIETDVNIHNGRAIEVRSRIAQDLGLTGFRYVISSTSTVDIYYNYKYSYHLSWNSDASLKKKLATWISRNNPFFALPKTKVLWITDQFIKNLEVIFDKSLFSVRIRAPGRLTTSYLDSLNPQIICVGDLPEVTVNVLYLWISEKGIENVLLISTTGTSQSNWHYIPMDSIEKFKKEFVALVKPLLLTRISSSIKTAKYFNRNSHFSRCAIAFRHGKVISISTSHMILETNIDLGKNIVFQGHCSLLENPNGIGLYLKTLSTEPLPNSSLFHSICEIIPVSDQPNTAISKWIQSLSKPMSETQASESPWLNPRTIKKSVELFFLEAQPFIIDIGKLTIGVIIFGVLGILAYTFISPPNIHSNSPAEMNDVFSAIRGVFK